MPTLRRVRSALLAAALLAAPAASQAATCPRIEIAPLASTAAPATHTVRDADGKVIATGAPIVSSADITGASVSRADGADGLGFKVTPAAGRQLAAYTGAHVGAKIAFVIDGRARMVVKILDPMQGDAFWISPFPAREGQAVADRTNACVKRP